TAHHPDFFYVPYMVTGDHFYMESLVLHQRYLAISGVAGPDYRDGRKGLWKAGQTRGQGWMMRTTVHTAYIIPDAHALRYDIEYQLEQNRIWYDTNYLQASGIYKNDFGFIWHGYSGVAHSMDGVANVGLPPWMDDFFTSACGRAVELGFKQF